MKDKLRWFHRWIGIPLGIMFFVTLASGAYVGYANYLLSVDDFGQTYQETTVQEKAEAINFIKAEFPAVTTITFPTEQRPFYDARNRADRAYVSITGDEVIRDMQYGHGPVYQWLLTLHRYYHLGRNDEAVIGVSGDHITAWMALFAVLVSLIGVYLWWPFRSKYKITQAVPMSNKRRAYFNAHLTSGLIVVGAIVLLGLSGASIQYRDVASGVLGATPDKQETGLLERPERLDADWATWLAAAQAKMPDGKMMQIDYPRGRPPQGGQQGGPQGAMGGPPGAMGGPPGGQAMGAPMGGQAMGGPPGGQAMGGPPGGGAQNPLGQAISVKFLTKGDWLSVPNSSVYVSEANSSLIGVKRFSQNSFGQKLFGMLNPLHTGNNITPIYAMVMALMATLAAIMIFSGVVSMFWNLLKKKREKGSIVIVSKGEGDKTANIRIEVPGTTTEGAPAE